VLRFNLSAAADQRGDGSPMNSSRGVEDLDRLLDQACRDINVAAVSAGSLGGGGEQRFKRILADALVRAWDAREILHALRPGLKTELSREADADPVSCSEYFQASARAHRLHAEGQHAQAIAVLDQFASSTTSACFAQQARDEIARYSGDN
jgi:hypothetical protein